MEFQICNSWWRHQMETFSALLAICAGNSPVTGELPAQRPVTRSFDVFFELGLNERLSKKSWGFWFETPSRPLWCHSNGFFLVVVLLLCETLSVILQTLKDINQRMPVTVAEYFVRTEYYQMLPVKHRRRLLWLTLSESTAWKICFAVFCFQITMSQVQ